MKFTKGQLVICTAPINKLEGTCVYEIADCHMSKIPGIEQANEFVVLKEFPDETFMSFRFRLLGSEGISQGIINQFEPITRSVYEEEMTKLEAETRHFSLEAGEDNSASKNDKEKVDLSLIPRISSVEHAKAFMVGERKYSRYNYCKGHKASQLVAAAKRHLDAWFEREERDPVDGQHHLGSVMACCSMILRQQELGTLKDDRYESN